jgi:hypothetical protein
MEGLVYDCWDDDQYTVNEWTPALELGEIDLVADFGGTDPFAIQFWQTLANDVEWEGRVLPQGAIILFDQIYVADIGNVSAGVMLNERIADWDDLIPGFAEHVGSVYRDVSAAAAARDWRKLSSYGTGPGYRDIKTVSRGGIKIQERIALCYELIGAGYIYVDATRCPAFVDEIGGYEYNENTGKPIGGDDHALDAMGYFCWNRHVERRLKKRGQTGARWQERKGLRAPAATRAWQKESPMTVLEPRGAPRRGRSVAVAIPRRREPLEM